MDKVQYKRYTNIISQKDSNSNCRPKYQNKMVQHEQTKYSYLIYKYVKYLSMLCNT